MPKNVTVSLMYIATKMPFSYYTVFIREDIVWSTDTKWDQLVVMTSEINVVMPSHINVLWLWQVRSTLFLWLWQVRSILCGYDKWDQLVMPSEINILWLCQVRSTFCGYDKWDQHIFSLLWLWKVRSTFCGYAKPYQHFVVMTSEINRYF